jgi:hypothetical protein
MSKAEVKDYFWIVVLELASLAATLQYIKDAAD